MIIETLDGNIEMLTDYTDVVIDKKINGEQTLQFTVFKTANNNHSYNFVKEESLLIADSENFVIKMVEEDHFSKHVIAISTFFELNDDYVEESYPNGLYTIQESLQLAFSTSDWSYSIQDIYPQRAKLEEFGNDNPVSMLNKILSAFNSEYEIDSPNNKVIIKRRLGVDTDYQVRNGYNITSINRTVDAKDVKTAVKVFYDMDEFGNYNDSVIYYSPNRGKYRRTKWRSPIYSDVITSEAQAVSTARLILKDTPDITFSVEFTTLQDMGYNSDEIQLGNGVFLIDEPLGIESTARIVEIREFYKQMNGQLVKDANRSPIVTISNIQKTVSSALVQQQQQHAQIERIAVKQQNIYNGCMISKEEGFTTVAENGVKTYQNSSEGIKITVNDVDQFFVDPINRQLTLDGRLYITNNQTPLFDAFLDNAGGNLKIYDTDGNLNVEIGSNKFDPDKNGGSLRIYDDIGGSVGEERIELIIERDTNAGQLRLMNNSNTSAKVLLTSNVKEDSMFVLADDLEEPRSFIGIERGYIDKSQIVTAATLQPILDAIYQDLQHLQDEIDDLRP